MSDRARRLTLLGAVALAIALAYAAGFGGEAFRTDVEGWVRSLGPWAPIGFLVVKFVTVVLALPSAPMALAGGVLFGPIAGTALNVLGATAGATVTFFAGRRLGRAEIESRLGQRLAGLDAQLADHGLWVMLFLRLVPLFPFNAINYGAGLTRVSFRDYFVGTALGIVPGAAAFTWLGHSAARGSAVGVTVGLCALGLLALVPVAVRSR